MPGVLGLVTAACTLCHDSKFSLVGKNWTNGFCIAIKLSHCSGSSKQQNRPCSSHLHSLDRFSPFLDLCGHFGIVVTHLQTPLALNLHVHEFEGLPGRLTVQKILLRQTGMPHEVVLWPRMHDMQAILQICLVSLSTTSIVLNGFSVSIMYVVSQQPLWLFCSVESPCIG